MVSKQFWQANWQPLLLATLLGVVCGLSVFTFNYAEGASYFSNDPRACVNCHVMEDQYDGWNRSSHKAVATCNDCHTPHTFPQKYIVKGLNGWNHSVAFTTGNFPDPIRIRPFNAEVVLENCIACHETMASNVHRPEPEATLPCVACHGNVGHGG